MKLNLIHKISIILLITSCSYLVKMQNEKNQLQILPETPSLNHCHHQNIEQELVGLNSASSHHFKEMLTKLDRLTFVDKVVLWSLIQMNTNPHLASPTAELQLIINYQGQYKYFKFSHQTEHSFPYLYGLEQLLKIYHSPNSLSSLATLLMRYYPANLPIDHHFEIFLSQRKEEIHKHPSLHRYFFKGEQTLKKNESLPRLDFTRIVQYYNQHHATLKAQSTSNTFSQKKYHLQVECNIDLNLYQSPRLAASPHTLQGLPFGLQDRSANSFLAISSQQLDQFQPILGTFLLSASPPPHDPALCSIRGNMGHIILASFEGRDPGQYIDKLLDQSLNQYQTLAQIDQLLQRPRILLLPNPLRRIIESTKTPREQIARLHTENIPIYNSKSLGEIWAHAFLKTNKTAGFVIDTRSTGHISCPEL